jgi:hypothetical protein
VSYVEGRHPGRHKTRIPSKKIINGVLFSITAFLIDF